MKKKLLSIILSTAMIATILSGCGGGNDDKGSTSSGNEENTDASSDGTDNNNDASDNSGNGTRISILNTKSEIQDQWEAVAKEYQELTGVEVEVSVTIGDSPSEDITKRYASGEVPTIFMGDIQDIIMLEEYALDLTGEKWAADGGEQYGVTLDEKLIGFPFCIEARGLIYNKGIIEEITGEDFDPTSIKTTEELKALFDTLIDGGMESTVAINKEDWNLAGHWLTQVYEEQDGTAEGAQAFVDGIKDGSVDLNANTRWTSLMDTFDLLLDYNMNKSDPLAADYDENAVAVAEGDVAFWFNGNWGWAEISEYAEEGDDYGIMPIPQSDDSIGATDKLCGGSTKYCMIDTKYNDEEQQEAAKEFLNWLVYDERGHEFLVEECHLIPPFSNITLEVENPLGKSVQKYAVSGDIFEMFAGLPSDHWKTLGAEMQKYLGGEVDRAGLADNITNYWKKQ